MAYSLSVVETPILKTKLVSQRSRSRLLDRPRLLSLLEVDSAVRPKLTVICGPAGYGKSTLVSQFIAAYPQLRSAWYSLDETDNNPDVFARYLVAAYEELSGESGYLNSELKPRDQLAVLFNAIQQQREAVLFVLDDFHWIINDRVLELFEWLLRVMPEQMSIVITTRETPMLDFMPELAVQGALQEITAEQLKFTQPETAAFVSSGHDVSLDDQSLLTLYQKTEGWVAGLQLSMHALKKQGDVAAFIQQFSGSEKDIVGYLGSVVLGQKSQEVQDFFLSCSVLKRFNGELCELVTGNDNARSLLEALTSEGLFIFELDRGWYRFHHLF
ncbi:MAG: AAA family ATPase, partial [Pseudomonadota bacterium]|nr:AAA family ATPase [Pseudomonadota bacterium]